MSDYYMPLAERGMAVLDEKEPGWLDRVDLATLDMEGRCILRQLFGSYDPRKLPGLDSIGRTGGFYIPRGSNSSAWAALTAAWKQAITERRSA